MAQRPDAHAGRGHVGVRGMRGGVCGGGDWRGAVAGLGEGLGVYARVPHYPRESFIDNQEVTEGR